MASVALEDIGVRHRPNLQVALINKMPLIDTDCARANSRSRGSLWLFRLQNRIRDTQGGDNRKAQDHD